MAFKDKNFKWVDERVSPHPNPLPEREDNKSLVFDLENVFLEYRAPRLR
jgi:hypothetical protein